MHLHIRNAYWPGHWGKLFNFGSQMKEHPYLIPLFGVTALQVALAVSYTGYMVFRKDYLFVRGHKQHHERVDLLRHPYPLKIITVQQEYTPMPDLADLYDEMEQAQKEQEAEKKKEEEEAQKAT